MRLFVYLVTFGCLMLPRVICCWFGCLVIVCFSFVCMVGTCFGLLVVGGSWFACVSCLCVV